MVRHHQFDTKKNIETWLLFFWSEAEEERKETNSVRINFLVEDQSRIEPKTTKQKKNKGTHKEIQIRELSQRGHKTKFKPFEFRYISYYRYSYYY